MADLVQWLKAAEKLVIRNRVVDSMAIKIYCDGSFELHAYLVALKQSPERMLTSTLEGRNEMVAYGDSLSSFSDALEWRYLDEIDENTQV